jgi:Phospholipase_D-nuclease N-terminal
VYYWGGFAIYLVLTVVFIADVLRQPESQLTVAGKVLWILALLVVPVVAWIVYGIWRIRQQRGLA